MDGTAVVGSLIEELTSKVSEYILEEVSLISSFREDFESLCDELENIKSLLKDAEGKRNSTSVCNWLEKLEDFLDDAVDIVEECQAGGSFWNPIFRHKMGRKMKKLNEGITKIKVSAKYLKYVASLLDVNASLESNSQVKMERLNAIVHPVGMEDDIQKITDLIVKDLDGPRVITVVGMGGQGKTLLVQSVFNQERVDQHFDHRFWVVVSQKLDLENVLKQMGKTLKREDISKEKIKELFGDLEGKRCLFVFDDVWDRDALLQLLKQINVWPIPSNYKIVITSRHRKVATDLQDRLHSHEMKDLSTEDRRKLFCIHAFPDCPGHLPPPELTEGTILPILEKCGGLPLAIKTIAASMARIRRVPNDWNERGRVINAMSNMVLPCLRSSYEVLPAHLKPCFLYFSLFPKGVEIECEYLVYMWIGQELVSSQVQDAYDVGRSYIDELIDRCLIEVSQVGGDERVERCKIHDLLHDLAISEQTKCLSKPLEQLENLPVKECRGLRRISVIKNHLSAIKENIQCPGLRTLLLSENFFLTSVSASFFNNLTHLRVLDLSQTAISSLPKSIGKLKHLRHLNLSRTSISVLPEFMSGLKRLQFLDVGRCSKLKQLHSGIGEHKSMLYLNVKSCEDLQWFPKGISELHHMQTLKLKIIVSNAQAKTKVLQLGDLKDLTLLQQLSLEVKYIAPSPKDPIHLEEGTFGGMKRMRRLSFINCNTSPCLILPKDMEVMEHLEAVHLLGCVVPSWISGLQNLMELELQHDNSVGDAYKGLEKTVNLKKLHLSQNNNCTEFPKEFGECTAFPKLEELIVRDFCGLEKFPPLQDTAMPMLKYFRLKWCNKLKNIAQGLERLKSLEEVELLRREGDRDFWEGEWLPTLKERRIKLKVSRYDQTTIHENDRKDIAIHEN